LLRGASGQCTMCEASVTGDWTYWDDSCKTKIGDHCLSDLGQWTTWYKCCGQEDAGNSGSQNGAATILPRSRRPNSAIEGLTDSDTDPSQKTDGKTDSRGNPLVSASPTGLDWVQQRLYANVYAKPESALRTLHQRIRSIPECNCLQIQATGGSGCSASSKAPLSRCQKQCCAERHCDCSWASRGCGISDGSQCWGHCCIADTQTCNCSFARAGGCTELHNGGGCWESCCNSHTAVVRVVASLDDEPLLDLDEGNEGIKVDHVGTLWLLPSSLLIWTASGLLAAIALSVVLFRASWRLQRCHWKVLV